jgi:hypothetical protein
MLSLSVTVSIPLLFSGLFSGDEKIPDTGSIPYSSRTPLSSRVIPVFLSQALATFQSWVG